MNKGSLTLLCIGLLFILAFAAYITYMYYAFNLCDCFGDSMTEHERKIMMELIENFKEVSAKHDVDWIVCGGTLIGTMRNGKIIPWDDDFDIAIRPNDMDKMPKVIAELSEKYGMDSTLYTRKDKHRGYDHFKIFYPYSSSKGIEKIDNFVWPYVDVFFGKMDDCYFDPEKDYPLTKKMLEGVEVNVPNRPFPESLREIFIDPAFRHRKEFQMWKICPTRKCSSVM